jgi:hypothetical protein
MDRVTQFLGMAEVRRAKLAMVDALMLAERLTELPMAAPEKRAGLTERLVVAAVRAVGTTRDLDAYEALSDHLRTAAVRAVAQQRAFDAVATELDYLLHTADEPEAIRIAAADLQQRGRWYGFEIDIGLLLDRADELTGDDRQPTTWLEAADEPADPGLDDDPGDIRRLFSRLAE